MVIDHGEVAGVRTYVLPHNGAALGYEVKVKTLCQMDDECAARNKRASEILGFLARVWNATFEAKIYLTNQQLVQ